MEIYPITRPASPVTQTSPSRSQRLQFLRGQLGELFGVSIPPQDISQSTASMGASPKSAASTQNSYRCFTARSSPPTPNIPATRPRSPESSSPIPDEAHHGFIKGCNTGDYKNPEQPGYQTTEWRHVPPKDKPTRALANTERHANPFTSTRLPAEE